MTREIAPNGGPRKYRSTLADAASFVRRRRPQALRLESHRELREVVERKLALDWSPEPGAGWLKRHYADVPGMRVSHESIYRALYIPRRSGVLRASTQQLRSRRKMRRSRRATTSGQTRGQIVGARTLAERPAEVESREVAGHWEGDLIAGNGNTHVATLVERTTRFTVMLALAGKDTVSVVNALKRWLSTLPSRAKRTLTWDRGTELARHAELTAATGVPVFFCDPQSPWQRGTNENTNRPIRQYLPKG
ncbi:MAG: IS30 family transposase, partial [Myxococcota bacterium]